MAFPDLIMTVSDKSTESDKTSFTVMRNGYVDVESNGYYITENKTVFSVTRGVANVTTIELEELVEKLGISIPTQYPIFLPI